MFYNIKNLSALTTVALAALLSAAPAFAQGVVTLSEEAMFDDDLPALNNTATQETSEVPFDPALSSEPQAPVLPEESIDTSLSANAPIALPAAEPEQPRATEMPTAGVSATEAPSPEIFSSLGKLDLTASEGDIFTQMSDIEKQTALLNLELRREKIKNEIEAVKNERRRAELEEQAKIEAERAQQQLAMKEKEKSLLDEQQKLRALDIEFEKLRQEKLLNAYKNEMLATNQEWITHEGELYHQIEELQKEKQAILQDFENKLKNIKSGIAATSEKSNDMVHAFEQEINNLHAQNAVLKSRMEAQEAEFEKQNPFAGEEDGGDGVSVSGGIPGSAMGSAIAVDTILADTKLSNLYAVMEVRGQQGELIAKLINKDGMPFFVKKGTVLQSGHIVDEITSTYVRADRDGIKDYLYFAAGGVLPREQTFSPLTPALPEAVEGEATPVAESSNVSSDAPARRVTSNGIPSLGASMFAR